MLLFGSNQPSEMTLIDVFVPITENSGMSMHDLLIIVLDAITILSGVIVFLKILQEFGNFSEYTPLQVKQAVTGNGKATKEQVAFMVKRLLNVKKEIKPLDITDAIAIALTHAQRL